MINYPLIEAMGLVIGYGQFIPSNNCKPELMAYIRPDDLERALEKAPMAYSSEEKSFWGEEDEEGRDTYTARLVCISKIKKESAEDLLREMVEWWTNTDDTSDQKQLINRARKLLEKK